MTTPNVDLRRTKSQVFPHPTAERCLVRVKSVSLTEVSCFLMNPILGCYPNVCPWDCRIVCALTLRMPHYNLGQYIPPDTNGSVLGKTHSIHPSEN